MNEARALGQASNTADDKWLLKSVLRGLRLLPRDEERERRTVAPVDLSHRRHTFSDAGRLVSS